MKRSIIVAHSENRVIGVNNTLPWHLPEDLKRFKRVTMGKPIIMGRNTYESIGRPLPGRHNIVVSGRVDFKPADVTVRPSIEAALTAASEKSPDEVFFIGGERIFSEALKMGVDRLYLTLISKEIAGDAFFPEIDRKAFHVVEESSHHGDIGEYRFIVMDRI